MDGFGDLLKISERRSIILLLLSYFGLETLNEGFLLFQYTGELHARVEVDAALLDSTPLLFLELFDAHGDVDNALRDPTMLFLALQSLLFSLVHTLHVMIKNLK